MVEGGARCHSTSGGVQRASRVGGHTTRRVTDESGNAPSGSGACRPSSRHVRYPRSEPGTSARPLSPPPQASEITARSPPSGNRLLRLTVRRYSRVLDGRRPSRERRLEFDLSPNRPDLPGPNHWSMVAHSHHPHASSPRACPATSGLTRPAAYHDRPSLAAWALRSRSPPSSVPAGRPVSDERPQLPSARRPSSPLPDRRGWTRLGAPLHQPNRTALRHGPMKQTRPAHGRSPRGRCC
jgi:hypothetical protein